MSMGISLLWCSILFIVVWGRLWLICTVSLRLVKWLLTDTQCERKTHLRYKPTQWMLWSKCNTGQMETRGYNPFDNACIPTAQSVLCSCVSMRETGEACASSLQYAGGLGSRYGIYGYSLEQMQGWLFWCSLPDQGAHPPRPPAVGPSFLIPGCFCYCCC
jgi:hypothetical protein